MDTPGFVVAWDTPAGRLRLVEPTTPEVRLHSLALAAFYNEPTNRALLTNDRDLGPEDVVAQFAEMRAEGGRPFLFFVGEEMVGDCDLRHVEGGAAEYAVLVGARARQGQGLGTRLSAMLAALAFGPLGLTRLYASVRPENAGSLRMLGKVGFSVDRADAARRFAEADDDVCLSLDVGAFARAHPGVRDEIRITTRALP